MQKRKDTLRASVTQPSASVTVTPNKKKWNWFGDFLNAVRKFYEPIEVEAEDHHEAEDKGYEFISANNLEGKYDSDDTYIYLEGEK
jgi:hypothetical protein